MRGQACFVEHPRRLKDLRAPHPIEDERPYCVVARVRLAKIDYENFLCDLLADRQFLEDHGETCKTGTVWGCLLVQQRGRTDGVLVIPERRRFVAWAAYVPECGE